MSPASISATGLGNGPNVNLDTWFFVALLVGAIVAFIVQCCSEDDL